MYIRVQPLHTLSRFANLTCVRIALLNSPPETGEKRFAKSPSRAILRGFGPFWGSAARPLVAKRAAVFQMMERRMYGHLGDIPLTTLAASMPSLPIPSSEMSHVEVRFDSAAPPTVVGTHPQPNEDFYINPINGERVLRRYRFGGPGYRHDAELNRLGSERQAELDAKAQAVTNPYLTNSAGFMCDVDCNRSVRPHWVVPSNAAQPAPTVAFQPSAPNQPAVAASTQPTQQADPSLANQISVMQWRLALGESRQANGTSNVAKTAALADAANPGLRDLAQEAGQRRAQQPRRDVRAQVSSNADLSRLGHLISQPR